MDPLLARSGDDVPPFDPTSPEGSTWPAPLERANTYPQTDRPPRPTLEQVLSGKAWLPALEQAVRAAAERHGANAYEDADEEADEEDDEEDDEEEAEELLEEQRERERTLRMRVHLPCLCLRGDTVRGYQSCPCEPAVTWPGVDVSRMADLCCVCGRGTCGGPSRWAWEACDTCVDINDALQEWVGIAVLPLGRHSIMNGVALDLESSSDADARAFALAMAGLDGGWQALKRWSHAERLRLVAARDPQGDEEGDEVPYAVWLAAFPVSTAASIDCFERLLGMAVPASLPLPS